MNGAMLHLQVHQTSTAAVAEFRADFILLSSTADVADLVLRARGQRADVIALHAANIKPEFFDPHTGLANNILQKLRAYRCRLAILGDISAYTSRSKSLRALVRDCNHGTDVWFVPTLDTLLDSGW